MADIVMTDDGIVFDGASLEKGPMGGAETAFLSLAVALAGRGHRVRVFNRCDGWVCETIGLIFLLQKTWFDWR